ncbi:23S rRNA (uracil(1939)-C(5))-methyltransferase RlmD [Anaerosporobacter sp.]|uniref:23S rRNA (uracil(1939)-C(5))-methyltransferase RlmD n=1 Tax=Anaerosporobacter sp. TaxID=1872529 RepID=UPI00286F9817|nr:23S rRNA (uracil(1939)-C(5))-methyltransferase RlmD [Anaerosporobacter sp.]
MSQMDNRNKRKKKSEEFLSRKGKKQKLDKFLDAKVENQKSSKFSDEKIKNQKSDKFLNRKDEEKNGNQPLQRTPKNAKELTFCPVAGRCGGCSYAGADYETTLKEKQKVISKLMKEFGSVEKIIGMKDPFHYRNKVHAAFGRLRNGTIISGTYEPKSHRIINVDSCRLDNEKADKIIYDIRNMLKSFKIKTYDEDTDYGLLRHVMVRCAEATGEVMVVLVLSSPILPSKNNFVKAIRKTYPEISTVIINVNDKKTSMVLGDKEQVIYGKGFIVDELCGLKFRISSKSFYQVNRKQTEVLYGKAVEFAGLSGRERVIDAYCGIGTIGMVAAGAAKEVIGVELNKDAIRDAMSNAKLNGISNVSFYCADAGSFMVGMAEKQEKVDVVFMDPPRAGSDEAFLDSVVKLAPEKVVYVSCNPEWLAWDVRYLVKRGYEVKMVQGVDMFGWTEHVETVCLMTKTERQ